MGVDTKITLPPGARARDVATVIAACLGEKVSLERLTATSCVAECPVATTAGIQSMPECCHLRTGTRQFLYHFEWSEKGERGMILSAYAENIAIAKRLVDFFGGSVDYNDCDDVEVDYEAPVQPDIHATDGYEWNDFQRRLAAVPPITDEEIEQARQHAAYKG